jgi:hypothetical protein
MKFLFHLYKINLGIALFLLICLKSFSSVAAFTLKTIGNSHELDLDSYAIFIKEYTILISPYLISQNKNINL